MHEALVNHLDIHAFATTDMQEDRIKEIRFIQKDLKFLRNQCRDLGPETYLAMLREQQTKKLIRALSKTEQALEEAHKEKDIFKELDELAKRRNRSKSSNGSSSYSDSDNYDNSSGSNSGNSSIE